MITNRGLATRAVPRNLSRTGLVLMLATIALAIPPPEPLTAYLARADLVLVGQVGPWERSSWCWQTPEVYQSQISVETVLKGELKEKSLVLEVEVHPEVNGGQLAAVPDTGRKLLFLLAPSQGRTEYRTLSPDPYAFQDPSPANLDQLGPPS